MIDPFDWNEDFAKEFALKENIHLSEKHWVAINFMRQYYSEYQVAPDEQFSPFYFQQLISSTNSLTWQWLFTKSNI